jgi:DNA-binding PadR family transcriptional regulator
MTERSELELATLGVVWRDGPCTPYHVRKQFLASPTQEWSGSAGTIYPLMRRLEEQGYLTSDDAERDRRGTRLYRVTPAGRRALKRWLRPPLSPLAVGPSSDLIRTRLLFIDALSASERQEFLAVVARQLDEAASEMRALEREMRDNGDRISTLAARGAYLVARARRDWFKGVCEELV